MKRRHCRDVGLVAVLGLLLAVGGCDNDKGTGSGTDAAADAAQPGDGATPADGAPPEDAAPQPDAAPQQDAAPQPDGSTGVCIDNNGCQPTEYCQMSQCGAASGTCAPRPATCPNVSNPVCGCDNVNYWNDCVREQLGVAASAPGECGSPTMCGGFAGLQCPDQSHYCDALRQSAVECNGADMGGICWGMPATCPGVMIGPSYRSCMGPTDPCISRCDGILSGQPYYYDSSCPQ